MDKVSNLLKKINIAGEVLPGESMSEHTSFKTGGPADIFAVPRSQDDLAALFQLIMKEEVPYFVLGSGANILVSDRGIRGVVIDCRNLDVIQCDGTYIRAGAGASISAVAERALHHSLSGLEFIYSMPGSVGGSVYMNARCYEHEISEILSSATVIHPSGEISEFPIDRNDFTYKTSPFQSRPLIITDAVFQLTPGKREDIEMIMQHNRSDREKKGHFLFPCAGSIFKNNRNFGKPSGVIIDSLGLKGYTQGGAQVAEFHGNIIINRNDATSLDIRKLIEFVEQEVYRSLGIRLEREIIYIGEWN